jgi:hypothetical protein
MCFELPSRWHRQEALGSLLLGSPEQLLSSLVLGSLLLGSLALGSLALSSQALGGHLGLRRYDSTAPVPLPSLALTNTMLNSDCSEQACC